MNPYNDMIVDLIVENEQDIDDIDAALSVFSNGESDRAIGENEYDDLDDEFDDYYGSDIEPVIDSDDDEINDDLDYDADLDF